MGALEDFLAVIKETGIMQALLRDLDEKPVQLLSVICKEYEEKGEVIPDHRLNLMGYFDEVMIRVLLSADMITREPESTRYLCAFRPTEKGLHYYRAMLAGEEV